MNQEQISPGAILSGPFFSEPMRVETVRAQGSDNWVVGLVGTQSERFRSVTLSSGDLSTLSIVEPEATYQGDGHLLRLGLQAYALGIAYEFAPFFGLSMSRVDPLPHQLSAVYDHLLKLGRIRFLLADDAGAGKTIMAGLLLRELVLPHPDRNEPEIHRLRPNPATESAAMRMVIEHERARGCKVFDVHEKNLGYDVTSLDVNSGELRLIEVKGLAAEAGTVILTPNERRVAEDRRECFWLYVVTGCATEPTLREPIQDPAQLPWHEVTKVQHYWLDLSAAENACKPRASE